MFKRSFFGVPVQHYTEKRIIGYTPLQMYKIASNVNDYKLFLPWIVDSYFLDKTSARLSVGFQSLKESYDSKLVLEEPRYIRAESQSTLFKRLVNEWEFLPAGHKACHLNFRVEFQFQSVLHAQVASLFMDQVSKQMIQSFEKRALQLYGKPSMTSIPNGSSRR
ncbi:coenzyme Q-binding protein COQ10-like B, mitochondrial [Gorgonomyces haynaldii]|nr:coenzyme Q-binding protein COQ10-like B, mitochondrial [Gorgonomyces haynaldii]